MIDEMRLGHGEGGIHDEKAALRAIGFGACQHIHKRRVCGGENVPRKNDGEVE